MTNSETSPETNPETSQDTGPSPTSGSAPDQAPDTSLETPPGGPTETQPRTALEWARFYLGLGLHPIPITPHGDCKKPLVAWKDYETRPPEDAQLARWFGGSGRVNIAVVLGRGLMAVDLDGAGAEDALRAAGIELPILAPRQQTANGVHVILEAPGPVGDRVALLASRECHPGTRKHLWQVDIRGVGYIVAAPSIHRTGVQYEWVVRLTTRDDIPAAPPALLHLIQRGHPLIGPSGSPGSPQEPTSGHPPPSGPGSAPAGPQGHPAATAPGGAPNWVAEALRGAPEGTRDATCARLAGYFLSKRLPRDVVLATLQAWATRCTPAFPEADVRKCVDSISSAEARNPDPPLPVPFQCLGFNRGSYYYLPAGSPQVVELTAAEHTGRNFLRLAPLWFWERNYPGERGANYVAAANALIRACERVGVYDESRVRGRGAWWDEKDGLTVLHMGDRIITSNGTATSTVPIHLVPPGHYIYEVAPVLRLDYEHPLSSDEACQLTDLLAELSWEQPISSRLLAGWLALAPICGAIEWRPHVFIVGAAGTGKTWVVNNIVRPVVGPIGLICQSETTEAGLRQTLGSDARPVIFDEAEGENMRAQARIQNVMALMRQSSSETGGTIIKGSMSGAAQSYQIRSCFLFSAINAGVHQHADVTRISILALRRNTADDAAEHFRGVSRRTAALLTREYISRLHARIYAMVPTIRANARTFAAAAAEVIGSQRAGDQVGTLLAGAYALRSDGLIDPQLARDWIAKNDWSDQKETQESTDEQLCVQRILTHIEVVRTGSGPREYAVGELLAVALGRDQSALVSPELAEDTLARAGILVDRPDNAYVVADHHPRIEAILRDSPWVVSWRRVLSRLPGASTTPHPRRFGPVARSRGTILPFDDARAETEFNFGKNRERAEQGSDEANRVPDSEY